MQRSLVHHDKNDSPIQAVAECSQVKIGILVKPQNVESPVETSLQVAEHRINPAKFSHLIRLPSIHIHWLMKQPTSATERMQTRPSLMTSQPRVRAA